MWGTSVGGIGSSAAVDTGWPRPVIYTSRDHVAPNAIHRRLSRIENKPVSKEINKVEGDSDGAGQQAGLARRRGYVRSPLASDRLQGDEEGCA